MLTTLIEQARASCEKRLRLPDAVDVEAALKRVKVSQAGCARLVHSITEAPQSQQPMVDLKRSLAQAGVDEETALLEQFLLVHSALQSLKELPTFPVSLSVKQSLCGEFESFACQQDASIMRFEAGGSTFVALCKLASLRRFPAGQFDWELSGLPRSWLLKIPLRFLPQVMYCVTKQFNGFAPAFFSHLSVRPENRSTLQETEANKSYHRIAEALKLQPKVKGLITSSWYHSPGTFEVSPHLAWLNKVFLEHGGTVAVMGPADPDCGVFHRSVKRRELYQAGKFNPTLGLVMWPRKEMIKWAATHPEFAR